MTINTYIIFNVILAIIIYKSFWYIINVIVRVILNRINKKKEAKEYENKIKEVFKDEIFNEY